VKSSAIARSTGHGIHDREARFGARGMPLIFAIQTLISHARPDYPSKPGQGLVPLLTSTGLMNGMDRRKVGSSLNSFTKEICATTEWVWVVAQ